MICKSKLKPTWPVAVAVLLATAAGCSRSRTAEAAKEEKAEEAEKGHDRVELAQEGMQALRLQFARAEERELSPSLVVTGEIVPVPDRRAEVGPLVSGRVVQVPVNVGDVVRKGSPLAVLQSPEIGKARAELTAARARLEVARQNHEREKSLFEGRGTSQRELQVAESTLRTAEADVQAVRTLLAAAGVGDGASSDGGRFVLTSPIAGTVVARSAHLGRSAEPSATLLEIVDLAQLWFLGDVFERDMRLVQEGQPVQVEVRAFPGEVFLGKVSLIGGTLDPKTRSVKVRVVLTNTRHRLRPGMFATAHIHGTHDHAPQRMLTIPWSAVQEVDDHRAVFIRVSERAFELRRLHTGERAGDLVEVLNGLQPGDEVVSEGSFLLKGELLRSTLGESE